MSYFDEVETWLTAVLLPTDEEDEEEWLSRVKKQIKAKILESYRNGQKAGEAPAKGTPDERPRESRKTSFRSRWKRNGRP
jgi:hypothetical protein